MSTADIWDADGHKVGAAELPEAVFGVKTNVPLIHQVVVAQLAAARQGTHSTKTRGEVSGGGRKPYRQKGTGRARQGSIRAPQFVGGGTVHGPKPRDYSQRTPKKMKAAALRGALSDRARHQRVHVVRDFVAGDEPVTRQARTLLERITQRPRVLVVATGAEDVGRRSVRNLPQVHLLTPGQLNTYDVMVSDDVVFTEAALAEFLASPKSGLEPRPTHDGDRAASSTEAPDEPKTEATVAAGEADGGEAEDEPKEDAK